MLTGSRKKIGVIGRVDPEESLYDGQTVKTRTIYRLLCDEFGEDMVMTVDTRSYSKRALSVLLSFVRCVFSCKDVVVLLSRNGRRLLFPVLSFLASRGCIRVHHCLIGGLLVDNIDEFPQWVKYLNSFNVNWVESHVLVEGLKRRGVCNGRYLANFKCLDPCSEDDVLTRDVTNRFCIFSRITEKKGVTAAINAIRYLNESLGKELRLDIYGPVDPEYRSEFERLLKAGDWVSYEGCIKPEESVSVLSRYDALLFPTLWVTEGIPGTVIDAFASGVPVIASKWQCYDEMLEDGVTGFGYEIGDPHGLEDAIRAFIGLDAGDLKAMGLECLKRSRLYLPDAVMPEIIAELNR